MRISTSRFGEIEVKESEWIVFKGAILGFESRSRYVLLIQDNSTPLWWLQSVDDPDLAFVVADPCVLKPDYNPVIDEGDLAFLGIKTIEDIALLAIVTVRSHPFRVTANLRAPILINVAQRTANQVILHDPDYPIQFDVISNGSDVEMDLREGCKNMEGQGRLAAIAAAI
ncbi:MAG: flagellar assembly protein FliW [Syntrophus sp. (in: bacteria)]|nr:flagellar assembly protein FliW [Syntrophus sp. (in: bacteria)]